MVQRRDRMKSLNAVLRLPADEFFGYIRGIDYGYMDAEGVVHRISPEDNCADQNGAPYRFSSPEQVVRNNCGWCWDIAELIRLWCERNSIEYKCVFLEYSLYASGMDAKKSELTGGHVRDRIRIQ